MYLIFIILKIYCLCTLSFNLICAGFAVNLDFILAKVTDFNVRIGYLESDFLEQLVTLKELEPKANCTKVFKGDE